MFGPDNDYPLFYDRKRVPDSLKQEYPQLRLAWLPRSQRGDRYDDLVREAEAERIFSRLERQPSRADRVWSRLQSLVSEISCRVRGYALRQPCPQPVS